MTDYQNTSRDVLVSELTKLKAESTGKQSSKKQHKKELRAFDFSKHKARHIALKVAYFGQQYHGLARCVSDSGEDEVPTIESHLVQAMIQSRLIPSMDSCGWSRSGRTDKGVSAFGQVISLWTRTTAQPSPGEENVQLEWDQVQHLSKLSFPEQQKYLSDIAPRSNSDDIPMTDDHETDTKRTSELPYLSILNRLLPSDIRVLGWAPVSPLFDARFSCSYRKYHYFFSDKHLNIPLMNEAASQFVGTFDFRNICKPDPSKAETPIFFTRTVFESKIEPVDRTSLLTGDHVTQTQLQELHSSSAEDDSSIYVYSVKAKGFLWHQVRNMMALLFLIGQGLESPSIIPQLLQEPKDDPSLGKPSYNMAPDRPLVLMECGYDPDIAWRVEDDNFDAQSKSAVSRSNYNKVVKGIKEREQELLLELHQHRQLLQMLHKMKGSTSCEREAESSSQKYVAVLKRPRAQPLDSLANAQRNKKKAKYNSK